MAKGVGKILVDTSEAQRLNATLRSLHGEFNTDRHLNHATRAAFDLLSSEFYIDTHTQAKANPLAMHHVYEWEHIGIPGFQLYRTHLFGKGHHRRVSWNWKASKFTVPTETTVTGEQKFTPSDKFDPSKLRRIHVFVWKAPMMEYGVSVRIDPKLSPNKLLVFPDADLRGKANGRPSPAVFTPHFVELTPGGQAQGNFTAWFTAWWGGGIAQTVLDAEFEKKRDMAFVEIFKSRFPDSKRTKMARKSFTITPDTVLASQGKNIAKAMARDMEHRYIEMARQRARVLGTGDEDE